MCFKRELDSRKNATSGKGSRKRLKYLYFNQLLFLLPHIEDHETQSNLNTPNDKEEVNNSQEEEKERPQNVQKKKSEPKFPKRNHYCRFCGRKRKDDTDVDEDRCFLLSLLPSFRQFNNEQKFLARMEILKITRHVTLQQNLDTYSSYSLPSFVSLQTHRILHPIH